MKSTHYKSTLGFGRRAGVHNTQLNYSFLSVRKLKSYTFRKDMSAGFLNVINTNIKLSINNLSATVYGKPSKHSEVWNIAQHSKESTWTKMKKFFAGAKIGVHRKIQTRKLHGHYLIRTAFSQTQLLSS